MLKDTSSLRLDTVLSVTSVTCLPLHADILWFCNTFDRLSVCVYTLWLRCKPKKQMEDFNLVLKSYRLTFNICLKIIILKCMLLQIP